MNGTRPQGERFYVTVCLVKAAGVNLCIDFALSAFAGCAVTFL